MAKKSIIKNMPSMSEASKRKRGPSEIIYDQVIVPTSLKQFAEGRKYFIRTYGCQANVRDSENIAGMLEKAGYTVCDEEEQADIIIINTCAVRENAEEKVYGEIGNLKKLKEKNPNLVIGICGCMIQQVHVVDNINDKFKYVDLLFGTHNINELLNLIDEVYQKQERIIDVMSKSGEVIENLPSVRSDKYKAFVNIMYGCDKFCTYCIVPYTRGKERSRKLDDVLKETQELLNQGYMEITYLGQNVNAYGKDLNDGTTFAGLLESAAKLGVPRIRFTTSHPWDFTDEMIEIIGKYDNIMPAIHLPFQSGNDEILRRMGRRYTSEEYRNLVIKMREKIPNLALTTDIIVGFPNETYEQFKDTLEMVKFGEYDGCFTFIYSPRIGTPAAKMVDDVTDEEKHKRFDELKNVVEEVGTKRALRYIGKIEKVLVDGPSKKNPELYSGYTETNKLIHFKNTDPSLVGKIVKVKILESHLYSLIGELVND